MTTEIGKRIIDISSVVAQFEAKEGDVEHIIGQTGQGKTYEATRRALEYLKNGEVVYTTWRLNLPEYFDERESFKHVFLKTLFFRKQFFRFDYQKNWHFVNLDDYLDKEGVFDTERFAKFLASRTDCIFMLDEGQDVFDSHQRAGKIARQSITRTRHMHKKLIIISQRAQAVDVNARANVTWFYKCVCISAPFLPKYFKVYMTEEVDNNNNYPLWVRLNSVGEEIWKAPVFHSGFARKEVYDAYDSWYMRKNLERSQDIHVSGYDLNFMDRVRLLSRLVFKKKDKKKVELSTGYPQVAKSGKMWDEVVKSGNEEYEELEKHEPKSEEYSKFGGIRLIRPTVRNRTKAVSKKVPTQKLASKSRHPWSLPWTFS